MPELMIPIPFRDLMNWVSTEYDREGAVFGVHRPYTGGEKSLPIFGSERIETPFGPAAGPNTQLAQNIVAGYFAGARFFELKTVQKLDGTELAACIRHLRSMSRLGSPVRPWPRSTAWATRTGLSSICPWATTWRASRGLRSTSTWTR